MDLRTLLMLKASGGDNDNNLVPFASAMEEGWSNSSGGLEATYSKGVVHVEGKNETEGWINILNKPAVFFSNPTVLPAGTYTTAEHLTVCIKIGSMEASTQNKGGTFTASDSVYVVGFYIAVYKGTETNYDVPLKLVAGSVAPTI